MSASEVIEIKEERIALWFSFLASYVAAISWIMLWIAERFRAIAWYNLSRPVTPLMESSQSIKTASEMKEEYEIEYND